MGPGKRSGTFGLDRGRRSVMARSIALLLLLLTAAAPLWAQAPADTGGASPGGSTPQKLPAVFRGLSASDAVRVGPVGSDTPQNLVVTGGAAQADLDFGQAYELAW